METNYNQNIDRENSQQSFSIILQAQKEAEEMKRKAYLEIEDMRKKFDSYMEAVLSFERESMKKITEASEILKKAKEVLEVDRKEILAGVKLTDQKEPEREESFPRESLQQEKQFQEEHEVLPKSNQDFQVEREPVEQASHPFQEVKEPVQPVSHPFQEVSEPVQPATHSFQEAQEPVHQSSHPFQEVSEPVHQSSHPFQEVSEPIHQSAQSFQEVSEPVHQSAQPFQEANQPVHQNVPPFQEVSEPVHQSAQPFQEANQPVHQNVPPFQEVSEPVHQSAPSFQPASQPVHQNVPPFQEPVEQMSHDFQPVKEPVQQSSQPAVHSEPDLASSSFPGMYSDEQEPLSIDDSDPLFGLDEEIERMEFQEFKDPLYSGQSALMSSQLSQQNNQGVVQKAYQPEESANAYGNTGYSQDPFANAGTPFQTSENTFDPQPQNPTAAMGGTAASGQSQPEFDPTILSQAINSSQISDLDNQNLSDALKMLCNVFSTPDHQ